MRRNSPAGSRVSIVVRMIYRQRPDSMARAPAPRANPWGAHSSYRESRVAVTTGSAPRLRSGLRQQGRLTRAACPHEPDPFCNFLFHLRKHVLLYGLVILCAGASKSRMRIGSELADLEEAHENSYCRRRCGTFQLYPEGTGSGTSCGGCRQRGKSGAVRWRWSSIMTWLCLTCSCRGLTGCRL